jgi:hypothetical protein
MGQRLVRLRLRPPPHSPARTEIFRLSANRPQLAGSRAFASVSVRAHWILGAILVALSLPLQNPVSQPETAALVARPLERVYLVGLLAACPGEIAHS